MPNVKRESDDSKSSLVAGVAGGLVVAAFVVDPLLGLAVAAVGGGLWYRKHRNHS